MKIFNPNIKRINRTYFWMAWFICAAITGFGEMLTLMEGENINEGVKWFLVILFLVIHFVCLLFLTIKRSHDVGYSTGYAIASVALVPLVIGSYMIFHVGVMESAPENEWGANTECEEYEKKREFYQR